MELDEKLEDHKLPGMSSWGDVNISTKLSWPALQLAAEIFLSGQKWWMTDSAILRTMSKVPYEKYIDASFVSPLYVKHTAVKPDTRSLVNGVSEQFDSNITYNVLRRKM